MECMTRPQINEEKIEQIRNIIESNPSWNRTKISEHICKLWGWQNPNGQLKAISCRDMLRKMDKLGKIRLPARLKPSRSNGSTDKVAHLKHDTAPVNRRLSELRPLVVRSVSGGKELEQFKSLIDQYHYLRYDRSIGENMKYLVYDREGRPLACLLFGSAAWSCRERDNYIGWGKHERAQGLKFLTNNSRFLIPPWITCPHLASHVLSLIMHRIGGDWRQKYGHPLYLIETFVEIGRFKGTCYKAANWVRVGTTAGRGRDGGHHEAILPLKDVYVYPVEADFREALSTRKGQAAENEYR